MRVPPAPSHESAQAQETHREETEERVVQPARSRSQVRRMRQADQGSHGAHQATPAATLLPVLEGAREETRGLSSVGERLRGTQEVAGAKPAGSIQRMLGRDYILQEDEVAGSSPAPAIRSGVAQLVERVRSSPPLYVAGLDREADKRAVVALKANGPSRAGVQVLRDPSSSSNSNLQGRVAQETERFGDIEEVGGANPSSPIHGCPVGSTSTINRKVSVRVRLRPKGRMV